MHLLLFGVVIFISNICNGSNFNPDYPNFRICVVSEAHGSFKTPAEAYTYLKYTLGLGQRCTHIYGNLPISDLSRFKNGSDPDLSFLESIIEISGSLSIINNDVKRIPLTNLKVIRGVTLRNEPDALNIIHNHSENGTFLEEIDLRNLRAIMSKNVIISQNPGLEYLEKNLDWSQILDDPTTQKLKVSEFVRPSNGTAKCHTECEYWTREDGVRSQFCFGPSKNECQKQTKCVKNKDLKWCKFTKTGEIPCSHECAGGCDGRTSKDCTVCNKLVKDSDCVSSCAPRPNHIFGMDSKDKLRYTVGGLCTSQCPASLLDQNKICVYECDFDAHQKIGNRCIECPNGNCNSSTAGYKLCNIATIDKFYPKNNRKYSLNKQTLMQLTNCTLILGDLDIDDISFNKNGVTVPMLYHHLKNVREIIGLFSLVTFQTKISNLTFLSNLEEIRLSVKSHTVASAMNIHGKYIEFLGLKKLKKVYGKISIGGTNGTCYLDRIPWEEISPDNRVKFSCNKTCDPLCTGQCWGPGNEMCYSCAYYKAGNSCVKQCSDSPGYFASQTEFKTIKCQTCHPLCRQNCTGPTPKNCGGQCRYAIEENTCVKNCSIDFFPVANNVNAPITCQLCHSSCFVDKTLVGTNHACTGPSNILGTGGCSKCEKLIKTNNNQYLCHKGSCPKGFYQSVINQNISHLHKNIVHQSSCEPCHSMCRTCSGSTNEKRMCHQCKGYFLDNKCVKECDNMKNVTIKLEIGDECPQCHKECRNGCLLANDSTACTRCLNHKLFVDDDKNKFSCVTRCPHDRNFTEYQDGDFICLKFEETINSKQRKTIFIILSGCFGFLVFIIGFCVLYFRWRANQTRILAEIKALYSNFKEPDMKNMKEDYITRPPNMRRMQMIPISDLVFDTSSKPLGSGAFGKVYRGYWKVPRQDNKYINLEVVIKVIHNSSKGSTDEFLEEAKIMASVSHRHCLPLIGVCLSLEKPCLVSTYAQHGSLDKYLQQNSKKISSHSMLKWAKQIADGMAYLNKRGIIHRDLAARNVLVNDDDNIQITDFGLARLVDETDDSIVIKSGKVPIRWLAIETLLSATYSPATDVWAYGVTLWEIFTYAKRPYEELATGEIKSFLQQGNRLCQPEISTLEVYMVMIKCWLDDPHMRPSFMELVSTFEQFIQSPKRFLYMPHEYVNQQYPKDEDQREMIQLNQISIDSDFRPISIRNIKSDETSWAAATLQNDSAYHLINNSYSKESDKSFLPKRKKAKRNISLERIKNFSKFDLNKILSPKSHRESKNFNYQHSSTYDSNKTTCTSIDSGNPFYTQRSNEYDTQPVNPQIAKLRKEIKHNNSLYDGSSKSDNTFKIPERIFIDKSLKEETEHLLQSPESRSPSLPPVEVPHVFPRTNPQFESIKSSVGNRIENSPDSGNSHNFDIDDYLIPSRISSAGYYNLTPSPSSNVKHSMELEEVPLAVLNKEYIDDDGYLEPKKFDR
uniref:receptor protein-tyrosine kinase n=1 Tax=Schmidtea mediterranea TaxID=79327 RepID=A0A1B1ACX9_SCHMD|nr:epidermal growth factor receptor Smed-egfr-3 [Schmidtea mediterranea]